MKTIAGRNEGESCCLTVRAGRPCHFFVFFCINGMPRLAYWLLHILYINVPELCRIITYILHYRFIVIQEYCIVYIIMKFTKFYTVFAYTDCL